MTLRARLFLLLGLVVVALVAAQTVLVRRLGADLTAELGDVAFAVGREVVSVFHFTTGDEAAPRRAPAPATTDGAPPEDPGNGTPVRREIREERRVVLVPPHLPAAGAAATSGFEFEHVEIHDAAHPDERTTIFRVHPKGAAKTAAADPVELFLTGRGGRDAAGARDGRRLEIRGPQLAKEIPVPLAGMRAAVGRFQDRMLAGSLALLVAGLALAAVVAHGVTRPLRRLAAAAREVEKGALGVQVGGGARGEVGEAIAAFDRMSSRLAALDRAAREGQERQHLAELGEVARGLAHSLRNPLHAVGLTLDELARRAAPMAPMAPAVAADAPPADEAASLAAAARAQIARMDRSIRGLLALATPGGAVENVRFDRLVEDVALEALQDARGTVRVRVEPAGGEPVVVRGVEAELRAVVQALVVNAVEASPPGGEVLLRASRGDAPGGNGDDLGVALDVVDAGPGLPPEVRAHLFEPHVTTKPTGSGMGLFLARRLAVARYGGSLALADAPGGGTIAHLVLSDRAEAPPAGGAAPSSPAERG